MSRRTGSYRRITQLEPNENDPEALLNPPAFTLSRAPLNTIQNLTENSEKEPPDSSRVKFTDLPPPNKGLANFTTPRTVRGKAQSEPNSAQSTPTKSVVRVFNNGSAGAFTGGRPPQCSSVSRGGSSCSRVSRGICTATGSALVEVPHIDLVENSSFWMDHNVQVLIRIRPISSTERALQGYGRCLRQDSAQTLTWLGNPETRFTFDHVACETVTQEMLFKVAGLPMVENCMSGYNSCMFAYGQTGSGKTYTMMGEIYEEMDNKLSQDCGMTPRIFEYLFTRIREEEENRRDEKLKYSCKCSFLEIYNEQITDLLEPSSTNLQLREDMKKGVYVENLTEYEVRNVKDVIGLLFQGAANRKMAATNMNSESSRSHSVFTCVIESRWEKDAMTHLRFGRLNLVDLAGSERQKSSGAEGERLKEAANINKSLSTLGLVIMTLVDVAHGKHRHVPYRDSRLTFLLQDSLGGNSKTTIIANISPSICCANETLSTLKFAQRAKLIQNNAKVNEDASGDVMALQRQIQQLKDQLTFFLRHQNALSFPSSQLSISEHGNYGDSLQEDDPPQDINFSCSLHENTSPLKSKAFNIPRVSSKKIKYLEATLIGSLRREKNAENEVQRLQAQIEHMNRLIFQREDDNQRTRMMLRFQEEKIRRLELLANGLLSGDDHLMEENSALSEEIQLLRARIDRNPELTRFALENIRILEQLRMFQDFYEHGERETLLAEVSELRDQLLEALTEQSVQVEFSSGTTKVDNTLEELENCKTNLDASLETNARLTREIADLRNQLSEYVNCKETVFHTVEDSLFRDTATIAEVDCYQPSEKLTKPTEAMDWQVDPQVEADVVEGVLCIGKQHANIQQEVDLENAVELQDRLCLISQENTRLATSLIDGDEEIVAFTSFVEKLEEDTMNLTSLEDGSNQPEAVATLIPERRVWTNGRLDRAVKLLIHKDNIIADLQKRLEEAQKMGLEMTMNLRSLRGATRAITEVQQQESNERFKEIIQLKKLLCEKSSIIHELESKIKHRGEQPLETEKPFSVELLTNDSDNSQIKESSQNQGCEFTEEKLYARFTELNGLRGQHTEICQSHSFGNYDNQLEGAHSEEKIELAMLEMGQMLQTFEQTMEEAEAGFHKTREMLCLKLSDARLVAAEKSNQANTLLLKFEEAQETIEEADLVLNALLKANENAKHETDMWKQAGQQLMAEKGVLIEEVQRLKASGSLTEQQCEITDSISSLEESLVQIHRDLEETFKLVYCDNFSFGRKLHDFIDTVRSLVEDIWSDMIEKHFALFVVQQCYLGFFLDKVTESIPYKFQVRSLEVVMDHTNLISENLLLKKELVRKDVLLKGLLFDFRLLQESASDVKDIKDESEEMMAFLRQVQHELAIKTSQLDDISVQHRMLEAEFSDAKAALLVSRSELEQAKGTLEMVSKENIELKVLLDDLHYRSAIAEQQLEEKQKVVEDLEKEIFRLDSSVEKKILSSTEVIDNALRRVSNERDRLHAKVVSLKDQLEMAQALADENEAIAVEARQVSEASKIYAEQKEEEAKILERSVEELECTINVLEKKVYEMGEEVDRQCLMREDLELELQALRPRMLTIQNATGSLETDSLNVGEEDEDQIPRYEEKRRIQILEKEILHQAEKIKQYEEYISELVLHAEAQTSQYHQKYMALEAMIHEAKAEPSSNLSISTVNKTEKTSTRIRGSGSPFKCIAGLVQQMNSEKDQELSLARLRIDELEALAASRQKEVCMLSARLAAAESMTHDVIRDLLGVKLDMTNYANLIDQQQVQKLAEKAQQFSEESHAKELEILKLRKQINDFIDERESLIEEINQRQTDTLAAQVAVEQLQQRDQMLAAQNGMLKMDKENLKRKVVELDEMVKKLSRSRNFQQQIHQDMKIREGTSSRSRNDEIMKRLAHSAKLLSRVNEVHSRFHKCNDRDPDLDSDEEQG